MNPNAEIFTWDNFQQKNQQEIQSIACAIERITNRTSAQVKPLLNSLLEQLVVNVDSPFYATATPQEWSLAFRDWVESHRILNLPTLPDEAISRESIYGERG
ncbi:hypothetical protein [Oscillatoria sp. FACHB-1406]|uniref:hypothetical protein n=1 Tax=Oscillatoria sp. FACHB-1406 TaxID=2692846 RepID=UPI001688F476|nr:hypothetical protein [Oscillatoria sp. FACHB-1406]MBD2577176.1 hypothetical protein [Oscillatoria sp. FACHB-1406]